MQCIGQLLEMSAGVVTREIVIHGVGVCYISCCYIYRMGVLRSLLLYVEWVCYVACCYT